jgi:long-subunit acyl-CoA synthetase (AMP-forming)
MEETKNKNLAQDEQIKEITAVNEQKQKDVNDRLKRVEEARKLNLFEDEKNRKLGKVNAAHKAKMQFIEEKYDYTSKAKSMALQDFKELMETNDGVNTSITPFTAKLEEVQKEI